MDPVLSSLLQTNSIGSDGFNWWIGQVETGRESDPKKSGRYRVRIVGVHLKEGQQTPTEQLPWANVVMPVTTPFSDGKSSATAELRAGNWVIGFFLDNDRQKPVIMGSIGHTKSSTVVVNQDSQGGGDGPRGLERQRAADVIPQIDRSQDSTNGTDPETGANIDGGEPAAARSNEEKGAPAIIAALRAKHSETNPIGSQNCVTIANPKCGTESNFGKQMQNIIGEMLAANQQSGGQLGNFYVSKVNGFLYDKVAIARHHIGRVTRLVRSLLGRTQSEIIRNLRQGIQDLINGLLGIEVFKQQKEKVPKDVEQDHKSVGKKGRLLDGIQKVLEQILKALGCSIENITDRIAAFLTNLLFNFIMDVFSPAACAVINLVEGIINKILELIEGLISSILGPLQSILSIIASPLNMIGGAISKVMSFLGISCSGPDSNCPKETVKCTDCSKDEDDDDWLDKMLDDIENGDTGERFYCEESQDYLDPKGTRVIFVGGVPAEPIPEPPGPPVPPGPGRPDTPEFDRPVIPDDDPDDDDDDIFPDDDDIPDDIFGGPDDDDDDDDISLPVTFDGSKVYSVIGDPTIVAGGDTVTFTVNTSNVAHGAVLTYELTGDIVEEYIDDANPSLTGTVTVSEYETLTEEFLDEEGDLQTISIPRCRGTITLTMQEEIELGRIQTFRLTLFDPGNTELADANFDTGSFADTDIAADYEESLFPDSPLDPELGVESSISVTTDKPAYIEGEDIIFSITSVNVDDNTEFDWVILGDVDANDFVGGTITGKFKIKDNQARVIVGILEDERIEPAENLTFRIMGTSASASATIFASGGFEDLDGDGVNDDDEKDIVPEYVPNKPTAGDPITGSDGSIVSIPINDTGESYSEAPQVIISGEGYGATAIALLDTNGFVSEIRVTRGGLGYKRNLAQDNDVQCIIDSFTLISPGIRYTSAPEVYINGDPNLATAIIDERGYVTSVQIKDRTKTYNDKKPVVKLIGGGGSGAIVLPNMICLSSEDLNSRGLVKIGTGRYIDCP